MHVGKLAICEGSNNEFYYGIVVRHANGFRVKRFGGDQRDGLWYDSEAVFRDETSIRFAHISIQRDRKRK